MSGTIEKIDHPLLDRIIKILARIDLRILGIYVWVHASRDVVHKDGRFFIQVYYQAPCTKTGTSQIWKGRKWYLSEFMTDDEVVKTAFAAFKAAIEHEIMEGFKVDGKVLFNPHVNFEALLKVSDQEVKRTEKPIP